MKNMMGSTYNVAETLGKSIFDIDLLKPQLTYALLHRTSVGALE